MPEALMPEFILSLIVSSVVTTICGLIIGRLSSRISGMNKARQEYAEQEAEYRKQAEKIDIITLRMAIYDEHFDLDEKLEAYVLYKAKHGNHRTKKYMDEQVGRDVDEYLARHPVG